MLKINNRLLCEYCLDELSADGCKHQHPSMEKLPFALGASSVLLGKYVIARVLGKGGFGITYLAWDNVNSRKVAIKEYYPSTISFREDANSASVSVLRENVGVYNIGMEKFYEEASMISRFANEDSIISVYEFFYENNTAYYVMEFLDGSDLKHYVGDKGGRLSERETLEIASVVARALGVVHRAGILHRDVSPDNIYMCRDGRVVLIDFGASRQAIGEQSKSLSVIL